MVFRWLNNRSRCSDPTYIRCFFYFADEVWKLAADHNELARHLDCAPLDEDTLQARMLEMEGRQKEPYCVLWHRPPVACMLHVVKDTCIWQVAYSAGEEVSDPENSWRAAMRIPWEKALRAYGSSALFVVNVEAKDLRQGAERLYGTLSGISSMLPSSPKGGEAEGEIGYLRHIGDSTFLLLIRKGSEQESADFQCGAFPRLEMQRHKASHYQRLARDSGELVRQAIDQVCTSAGGKASLHNGDGEGLSRLVPEVERLQRLVDVSLGDLDTMACNVEKAYNSYQDLAGEWGQQRLQGGLWGQFLRRLGISAENTRHEREETRKRKDSLGNYMARLKGKGVKVELA